MRSVTTSQTKRSQLPGLGKPLNWMPFEGTRLFPNSANQRHVESGLTRLPLTTLREFTMLHLLDKWTDELDWHIKAFDDEALAKWKTEALAAEGSNISDYVVDCCFDELRYKAKVFDDTGAIGLYRGQVVKSDLAIPPPLQEELKNAILPLEQIPTRHQDWRPTSGGRILSLVDPSLFPLMYGRSRVLIDGSATFASFVSKCGEGAVIPVPPELESNMADDDLEDGWSCSFSRQFQWLPCDVDITGVHGGAKITSYINNLHPVRHVDLYRAIENILGQTIPLWNLTLTPLRGGQQAIRIPYHFCTYETPPPGQEVEDEPEQESGEGDDSFQERQIEWMAETHQLAQPLPNMFKPPREPKHSINLRKDYAKEGLQIIVKLETVYLTPEEPEYKSGTWLLDGRINEHICATALYYYDCTNVGASQLVFRQQTSLEDTLIVDHSPNQHDWLPEMFGREFEEAAVQEVGGISIREGRLVTWPNILQHQVHMRLADSTQPGHCKILALYLVDPNIRIISTVDVPCQRRDWWAEAVLQRGGLLAQLPVELRDHVFTLVDEFPVGLEEAKKLRDEMDEDRRAFAMLIDELVEEDLFSCDH